MFLNSLLSANAFDTFEPIAKWLTVGFIAALVLLAAVEYHTRKDTFARFAKNAFFVLAAYLLVLAAVFFALDIAKHYSDEYAAENWLNKTDLVKLVLLPMLVLVFVALTSLIGYALLSKYAPARKKPFTIVALGVCAAALIAVLVCLSVYYRKHIQNDGYYNSETATVKQLALYLGAALSVLLIVGLTVFDKRKFIFDARSLAYAGILAAMSFALSYIKLWDMPHGGSVTLVSLLPLMLYAYIFGTKKGVFVGFTYGLLQAVQDPWLIHPAQFLLDYPIGFAAVGLAGLLSDHKAFAKLPQIGFSIGAILAGSARFICHVLSGVFAFEAYAEGQNVWAYSLLYNAYVFVDVALVIVAGVLLYSSASFTKTAEKLIRANR